MERESFITPHAAIICGKTNSGKTHQMLDMIVRYDLKDHYDNFIIICPTFYDNKTYKKHMVTNKIKPDVISKITDFSGILESIIKLHSHGGKMNGQKTLLIIDDCSAEVDLDKKRGALASLAFSGRHINITTWFVSQRYVNVPKNFRDNVRWILVTKNTCKDSFALLMRENDIIPHGVQGCVQEMIKKDHMLYMDIDLDVYSLY